MHLDFDDSDIEPENFLKMFPDLDGFVHNSLHNAVGKWKYHAVFALSQPVTPEAYEMIWDMIALKIKDAGYHVPLGAGRPSKGAKLSELDRASRTPTQFLRLACQAENGVDSFFIRQHGVPIDPIEWIENNHYVPKESKKAGCPGASPDLAAARAAVATFVGLSHGERNRGMFELYLALKCAHIPKYDRDDMLLRVADQDFPDDRRGSRASRIKQAGQLSRPPYD
ncbi:MAG: hypothetical protein ABSD11_22095 [Methylocella sp.]|jgi:hypothetical protein